MGPLTQLPGMVVHPQQQQHYPPSRPLYPQDVTLQEVPNGHDLTSTGRSQSKPLTKTKSYRTQFFCLFVHVTSLKTVNEPSKVKYAF